MKFKWDTVVVRMPMSPLGQDLNAWFLVAALFRKDWKGRDVSLIDSRFLGFKRQVQSLSATILPIRCKYAANLPARKIMN